MGEEELDGRVLGRRAASSGRIVAEIASSARPALAARDGHRRHRLREAREIEERVGVPTYRKLPPTVRATRGPARGRVRRDALGDDARGDTCEPAELRAPLHRGYFTDGRTDR